METATHITAQRCGLLYISHFMANSTKETKIHALVAISAAFTPGKNINILVELLSQNSVGVIQAAIVTASRL